MRPRSDRADLRTAGRSSISRERATKRGTDDVWLLRLHFTTSSRGRNDCQGFRTPLKRGERFDTHATSAACCGPSAISCARCCIKSGSVNSVNFVPSYDRSPRYPSWPVGYLRCTAMIHHEPSLLFSFRIPATVHRIGRWTISKRNACAPRRISSSRWLIPGRRECRSRSTAFLRGCSGPF